MIMVEVLENIRYFEAEDADFTISFKDGAKELLPKHLKAMSIKHHIYKGLLKVVEGEFIMTVKHAKVLFSAELYPYAYGIEFGKFFKKDLQLDSYAYYPLEGGIEIPNDIKIKLVGEEDAEEGKEVEETEKAEESNDTGSADEIKDVESTKEDAKEDGIEEVIADVTGDAESDIYTEKELMDMNKTEQVDMFLRFGFKKKDIPKKEADRVKRLLELQTEVEE